MSSRRGVDVLARSLMKEKSRSFTNSRCSKGRPYYDDYDASPFDRQWAWCLSKTTHIFIWMYMTTLPMLVFTYSIYPKRYVRIASGPKQASLEAVVVARDRFEFEKNDAWFLHLALASITCTCKCILHPVIRHHPSTWTGGQLELLFRGETTTSARLGELDWTHAHHQDEWDARLPRMHATTTAVPCSLPSIIFASSSSSFSSATGHLYLAACTVYMHIHTMSQEQRRPLYIFASKLILDSPSLPPHGTFEQTNTKNIFWSSDQGH